MTITIMLPSTKSPPAKRHQHSGPLMNRSDSTAIYPSPPMLTPPSRRKTINSRYCILHPARITYSCLPCNNNKSCALSVCTFSMLCILYVHVDVDVSMSHVHTCNAMRCTRLNAHARESIELAGKRYRAGSWDAGNLGTWGFGKVALGTYVPMSLLLQQSLDWVSLLSYWGVIVSSRDLFPFCNDDI